jgi:hypothetical protein
MASRFFREPQLGRSRKHHSPGMKAGDRRRAMDVVKERQAEFLTRWREIQGGEQ